MNHITGKKATTAKKPSPPKPFAEVLNLANPKKFVDEFLKSAKHLNNDMHLTSQFDLYLKHLLTRLYQSDPALQLKGCPFLTSKTNNVYELLKRDGPVFKAIFDHRVYQVQYDWPIQFLPIRTQYRLSQQDWRVFPYAQQIRPDGLLVVDSHVLFFLQFATFPLTHILGKQKTKKNVQNSIFKYPSNKPFSPPDIYEKLFNNYLKCILPLPNDKTSAHLPDLDMYMMTFMEIFCDQWLNRVFDEIIVQNRALLLTCIDRFTTRLLHRQYEYSASSHAESEYFCPELRLALPPLFHFFRTSFTNWPLDHLDQVKSLIDLWLKVLTPWETTKVKGTTFSTSATNEENQNMESWSQYIDQALPFYTVLLMDVLRLAVNFEFSNSKPGQLLEKVLKRYTPILVNELQSREMMLYNRHGAYSVRMEGIINSIQILTEQDVQQYVNEYLIFTNQETTMIAEEVAIEFARYQFSKTKPKKEESASWLPESLQFLAQLSPKPKLATPVSLENCKIIQELQRLFHISVPRNYGWEVSSASAEVNDLGYLTDAGRAQVVKGSHKCPMIRDQSDVDVWAAPVHSWEREPLLDLARNLDTILQVALVMPSSAWRVHWLYGRMRHVASIYFWWLLFAICLVMWFVLWIANGPSAADWLTWRLALVLGANALTWQILDL